MLALVLAVAVSCTTPNVEPDERVSSMAFDVDHVKAPDKTEVDVRVTIDASGKVTGATLEHASGDFALDEAAVYWATKRTGYTPGLVDCKPAASTYLYRAIYDAPGEELVQAKNYAWVVHDRLHPRHEVAPRPFARFCSAFQNLTDAQVAQRLAEHGIARTVSPSDERVAREVATMDPSARSVNILVRDYREFAYKPGEMPSPNNLIAVEVHEADGSTQLQTAVFSKYQEFLRLDPLTKTGLEQAYGFAREMAAYMLLNDLLGGDTIIPRQGCVRMIPSQFGGMPGVIPEITAAMMTVPQNDAPSVQRARFAYEQFAVSRDARFSPHTMQTLKQLGKSPPITFVYRDPDTLLGITPEIDIVRIGSGAKRTYAMVAMSWNGDSSMDTGALCFVGDQHCSPYYVWP